MSSKPEELPIPTESSSPLEKLQWEHAKLYSAYSQRGQEIKDLESLISKFQGAFATIDCTLHETLKGDWK